MLDSKILEYDASIGSLESGLRSTNSTLQDVSYGLRAVMTLNKDDAGQNHPVLRAEKFVFVTNSGVETTNMTLKEGNADDVWFNKGNDTTHQADIHINDVFIERGDDGNNSTSDPGDECSCDSAISNSNKISVYDTLTALDTKHIENKNQIDAITQELATKATDASLNEVSTRLDNASTGLGEVSTLVSEMYEHDTRSVKASYYYLLDDTHSKTGRIKYEQSGVTFETNAETPMPIFVEDVKFQVSDDYESLQEVHSDLITCKSDIEQLKQQSTGTDETLDGISTKVDGGYNVKGNNATFERDLQADTIIATHYKVSGNDETFEPKTPEEKNVGAVFSSVSVKMSNGSAVELYQKIQEFESTLQGYTSTVDEMSDVVSGGGITANGAEIDGNMSINGEFIFGNESGANIVLASSDSNVLSIYGSDSDGRRDVEFSKIEVGTVDVHKEIYIENDAIINGTANFEGTANFTNGQIAIVATDDKPATFVIEGNVGCEFSEEFLKKLKLALDNLE